MRDPNWLLARCHTAINVLASPPREGKRGLSQPELNTVASLLSSSKYASSVVTTVTLMPLPSRAYLVGRTGAG